MESSRMVTAATLFVVGATVSIYFMWRGRRKAKKAMVPRLENYEQVKEMKWESVGRVQQVFVYPVKSCKGNSVQAADTHFQGFIHNGVRDRSFMLTTEQGTMITGRMVPTTVLIQAKFEDNTLTLQYPGSEEFKVDITKVDQTREPFKTVIWGEEVTGLDCGKEVSQWLENIVQRKCKLLYHANLPASRVSRHGLGEHATLLRDDDQSLYADFSGYMLMTTDSIADLQSRVSSKIAVEDFRPNILVEGTKAPYDEDAWQYIKIGDAVFRNIVPCTRCSFTTVSAETGTKNPDMEPLRTLKLYRCVKKNDPFFGINLGLDLPGVVSVGEEVFATRADPWYKL